MLLWHLAARWGRVRSDGTVLRLRLTHTVLADLVAARRPTVTTALSELTRRGLVRTDGETWVLPGEAPSDLLAFAHATAGDAGEPPTGPAATEPLHIDPYIVLGSAIIGLLVGMTGAGGGALMTPMLILLFGVTPAAAISSDLVAAVVMRPFGAGVHLRAGTVNLRLVKWMVIGSVPAAFLGAYLLHVLGNSKSAQTHIETVLGIALLIGASAMALRFVLDRRGGQRPPRRRPRHQAAPASDDRDRHRRRRDRRHDLGRIGLADDRAAAVRVSDDRRQPARRHRPDAGGPADARGRARRARLRPRRARRHRLADHRQRPRGAGRVDAVLDDPRPLRPPGDRVRDLRLRAQVRRPPDHRARLDAVRAAVRRRGHVAVLRAAVADARGRRPSPTIVHALQSRVDGPRLRSRGRACRRSRAHVRPRARPDSGGDGRARGGAAPQADRRPGGDRAAHVLLGRDARGVLGCGLLPPVRPAALRRLRVRRADLRQRRAGDRPRVRVDRVVPGTRDEPRADGRLVVAPGGAGRDLRGRRLPLRVGRGAGRARGADRRRLGDQRPGRVRVGLALFDLLHGPGDPARAGRRLARGSPTPAPVRRSAQRVGDARRLGRHARSEGLGLAQHPLPRDTHSFELGVRGEHARPRRRRRHSRARACTATRCTRAGRCRSSRCRSRP